MSIPMAPCWAMRMSSPRSRSAAPITKRLGWARVMWISSSADRESLGRLAGQPGLPNRPIAGFQIAGEGLGIEQGASVPVRGQLLAQLFQGRRVLGQLHGQGFEVR